MLKWSLNKKTGVWSGKQGDIEVVNFEVHFSFFGEADSLKCYPDWSRIRSVWNSRQDLYSPRNEFFVAAKLRKKDVKLYTIDDIRKYCETRFKDWLKSANLEVKNGNQA